MERNILSTKQKAVKINIEDDVYGILAEIGGGQEVARAFFQAGGASGSLAKSISAYDKNFSDALYNDGKAGRYVSEDRLLKMLSKEYDNLVKVIGDQKECKTQFFAFADTVETLNYQKDNKGHGWMGVRFQKSERNLPNEIIIHFQLLENDGLLQQYTLGILGVNLIYACFHYIENSNDFLQSLMDNLDNHRIDVNMVRMSGPDLNHIDNRLLGVQLVKNGMTQAVVFDKDGNVQQPSDMLYKKDIIVIRGSFRPITYVGFDMIKTSYQHFKRAPGFNKDNTLTLCEITLNNLMSEGNFDEADFLSRVDILNGMRQNVLISNYKYFYRLVDHLNQFKLGRIRVVMGAPTLENILQKKYYNDLTGGILEAFGRLFAENVKLYIYPLLDKNEIVDSKKIKIDDEIKFLFQYLVSKDQIIDLENVNPRWNGMSSHQVLKMIQQKDHSWEDMMPKYIVKFIKSKHLFGCDHADCVFKRIEQIKI